MENNEIEVPPEEPETAPGDTLEGTPEERTREAGRHADRVAREDEAAEGPPGNAA